MAATPDWMGPVAVLVPVKAFGEAKVRLAPALTGTIFAKTPLRTADLGGKATTYEFTKALLEILG